MTANRPRRVSGRAAVTSAAVACAGVASIVWAVHRPPQVEVTMAEVTRGAVVRRIIAAGTLRPVRTVDVGAQVSGTVQSLDADFNTAVRTGQVIARLEPSAFQAALEQSRAGLQDAEAALVQARADYGGLQVADRDAAVQLRRAEALAKSEIITEADLDAARTQMQAADDSVRSGAASVRQAEAAVGAAQSALQQAQVNLDYTIIRSPVDGVVLSRSVDVGQTVAASVQAPVLFTIATDLRRLQAEVDVDEADVGGLQTGQVVSFTVESYPDATFRGTLTQVRLGAVVIAAVVSYAVMIDVDNQDERLRPGMTALLALEGLRHEDVLRVPNSALAFHPPIDVLAAIGQPEPQPLAVGTAEDSSRRGEIWRYDGRRFTAAAVTAGLSDASWTEVSAGSVAAGDRLVTSARLVR